MIHRKVPQPFCIHSIAMYVHLHRNNNTSTTVPHLVRPDSPSDKDGWDHSISYSTYNAHLHKPT